MIKIWCAIPIAISAHLIGYSPTGLIPESESMGLCEVGRIKVTRVQSGLRTAIYRKEAQKQSCAVLTEGRFLEKALLENITWMISRSSIFA
jgi:hypothetical protein